MLSQSCKQNGFTLVEFMVGVAILGISALAMMQLVSVTLPMVKDSDRRVSFESIVNQVNIWIQNEDACRVAFGGPGTLGGAVDAGDLQVGTAVNGIYPVKIYNPSDKGHPASGRAGYIPFTPNGPNQSNPFPDWTFPAGQVWIQPLEGKAFALGSGTTPAMNTGALTINAIPVTAIDPATGLPDINKARSTSGSRTYNPAKPWDDGNPLTSQKFTPTIRLSFLVDSNGYLTSCGNVTYNSYGGSTNTSTISGPIPDCPLGLAPTSNGTQVHCVRVNCDDQANTHIDPSKTSADGSVSCISN